MAEYFVHFQAFMVMVWNFELYMLPLTLIMLFMWCLIVMEIKGTDSRDKMAFVSYYFPQSDYPLTPEMTQFGLVSVVKF